MKREPAAYSPEPNDTSSQQKVSEESPVWSAIGHPDENSGPHDEQAFRQFIQSSLSRKKPSPAVLHNIIKQIQRTS